MFSKSSSSEGSTQRLVSLCVWYFLFYVLTGISVKYFQGNPKDGLLGFSGFEFLVYSTIGGQLICLLVVLFGGWYKLEVTKKVKFLGMNVPVELLYIIPSGICTAVVIPTTTLMYSLPISVMVAMIIMRGSIIIISRIIDSIQIHQGLLKKKVYAEENLGVFFSVLAIGSYLFWAKADGFDFLKSTAALTILGSYLFAYSIRIYIMNYFKNTASKGVKRDNKVYFGIEQIAAGLTLAIVTLLIYFSPTLFGVDNPQINEVIKAFDSPRSEWPGAILAGMAFGMVAFFSVFLFMFKGRTATFAGLVNRLTSLVAGTAATLISYFVFNGKFPSQSDWISLVLIFVAVWFIAKAEKKRAKELAETKELEGASDRKNAEKGDVRVEKRDYLVDPSLVANNQNKANQTATSFSNKTI
ncbi:MAG: hypothetical protein HQK51_00125 [Oligoflexia bacterium]|nr:hypothetical protein [Oligoflexia bacterium]